jgi:hypothetical protein
MKNYWLSEYSKNEEPEDEGPEQDPEANDVKGNLTDRQQEMYEDYEKIVEKFGLFKQDSKADGAHYAPASANPFKEEGLMCSNCVFYIGGGACEIVKGKIEPEAICKLWIIPNELLKKG